MNAAVVTILFCSISFQPVNGLLARRVVVVSRSPALAFVNQNHDLTKKEKKSQRVVKNTPPHLFSPFVNNVLTDTTTGVTNNNKHILHSHHRRRRSSDANQQLANDISVPSPHRRRHHHEKRRIRNLMSVFSSSTDENNNNIKDDDEEEEDTTTTTPPSEEEEEGEERFNDTLEEGTNTPRGRMRDRIKGKVKQLVRPVARVAEVAPGRAIASMLKDATVGAVEIAVAEVGGDDNDNNNNARLSLGASIRNSWKLERTNGDDVSDSATDSASAPASLDALLEVNATAANAFADADDAIAEAELVLSNARDLLSSAKEEAFNVIDLAAAKVAARTVEENAKNANRLASKASDIATSTLQQVVSAIERKEEEEDGNNITLSISKEPVDGDDVVDLSSLSYDDVGYETSEMAPPFIGEDQCLVPGEAVVRVEKAPENSRRIFAGIDIMASVDDVWKVLTDYENLQNVVPNLVVNEVVKRLDGTDHNDLESENTKNEEDNEEVKLCRTLSLNKKGSILRQVGGARVVGINFSARCTLEVREWPNGLPDRPAYHHILSDDGILLDTETRDKRVREDGVSKKLCRYLFPRPFAISSLPTRDITMQSILDDDGEFRMYQGVWRMQPLPGCAPVGEDAMRLTYAVEISPRSYLPVSLVEGRIARDLCSNLMAIRDFVSRVPVVD